MVRSFGTGTVRSKGKFWGRLSAERALRNGEGGTSAALPRPAHESSPDQCPERPESHPTSNLARPKLLAHSFSMLLDEQPSPEQVKILRAIPGAERLRLAERLYWSARKMKAAGLRAQHPDWPEERVGAEVRRIFLNGRT
jgi:hypothetical protein